MIIRGSGLRLPDPYKYKSTAELNVDEDHGGADGN